MGDGIALPKCTLCDNYSDPRCGLNVEGGHYPLCDGCPPNHGDEASLRRLVAACRAKGPPMPYDVDPLAEARAQLAEAQRERDEARAALSGRTVSCGTCQQATADAARLREMLREAEWDGHEAGLNGEHLAACALRCGGNPLDGHAPGCRWVEAVLRHPQPVAEAPADEGADAEPKGA